MYLYTHIDVDLNLEIQNGMCTQELTERGELPVSALMTACWDRFNFAEKAVKDSSRAMCLFTGSLKNSVQVLSLYMDGLTKMDPLIS